MKRVTVELIIDEDDEGRVADGVSEILTDQMQSRYPDSCLVDWQYAGGRYNAVSIPRDELIYWNLWNGKPIC